MAVVRGIALCKSVQCGATHRHSRRRGPKPLEQTTLASLEFKPQMRAPSQRRPMVREGRAAAHRWSVVTGGGRARAGLQRPLAAHKIAVPTHVPISKGLVGD